jgi:hypothetical protein
MLNVQLTLQCAWTTEMHGRRGGGGGEIPAGTPTNYFPMIQVYSRTNLALLLPCLGYVRGPIAKFVDWPYYSESELSEGAVTVSFSKYLPWEAMHVLQRSTHFSKACCRPLITSKFLAFELPFHGWKSPEITWSKICI